MTTIYAVYTNDGCVGRCDAKCHEAKGDECRCICGGAFHGVGSKIAWADRKTLTDEEILSEAKKLYGDKDMRVLRQPEQLGLFDQTE